MKSNRFIKLLDWYIIKKFLGTYVFAIALIISIAVVFDFNEKMDKFMEREAPWSAIVFDYYMNFIPYFANLFSPLFVFIAVIFFTSKLAENSEIIAMFSTGMSFKRLMRPYMISAAVIAVATFMLGSYVIPKGSVTRLNFEDRYVKSKKKGSATNVQLEVDSGVIAYIDRYQDYNKTGNRFSLDKFVDKKLVSHLTARRIVYDTTTVNKWTIHDYMIRELDGLKENIIKGDRLDTIINMDPTDFLIMKNQQEMLTSPQLSEYIDKQRRRGFANIKEFEIEYHKRIAMSFASFILTVIGLSLSSKKTKGGMGLHLGIGLALSFSYILFEAFPSTQSVWFLPVMIALAGNNLLPTHNLIHSCHHVVFFSDCSCSSPPSNLSLLSQICFKYTSPNQHFLPDFIYCPCFMCHTDNGFDSQSVVFARHVIGHVIMAHKFQIFIIDFI